ncbi:aldehyde dehydrogenase family domain-containing protein [Ditylenchus destructor]|nr:aldehyde dehydrogenase family domain-containing protein [Ditylenchus destructor]
MRSLTLSRLNTLKSLQVLHTRNVSSFTGLTSEQFMKKPTNEPILEYKKGSSERKALEEALENLAKNPVDVPLVIGSERITRKLEHKQLMPSDNKNHVARFTYAQEDDIKHAIEVGLSVREKWERKTLRERADILLHAADLSSGKYRMLLNASTMLGQGKNMLQAEIDSACELIDFFRFNSYFALQLEKYEPISTKNSTNRLIYRGLEGFVAAIAPFNFTAIGGNLAAAPALMGNVVMWKPSDTAVLSNYIAYQILEEAGIPSGVLSFLPSDGPVFGNTVCDHRSMAAINFTGSVPTFQYIWGRVAKNLNRYITFPRLVGECGGKNFHFIHPSADVETVVNSTIRSAFEYQGQKCSACSRAYVPKSLWPNIRDGLVETAKQINMGDVRDGSIFMSAVIDAKAFERIKSYIDYAKSGKDGAKIIAGGSYDDTKGYFIQPTIVEVNTPISKLLTQEIFGPLLTVYVYDDKDALETVSSIKDVTRFGLTGAVFSQDKEFLSTAKDILRDAVGNLYLNDKCTGSVVGQQPFGGARLSGTNDKAGGPHYALKWASPQTIKETFVPIKTWKYPHME